MRNKGFKSIILMFTIVGLLVNPVVELQNTLSSQNNYYPTNGWLRSDPEDLGLDPIELDKMYQTIIDQNLSVDSVHVVRYGYLCYEKYFEYYNESNLHDTYSASKSIISILIGIATSSGLIADLDEPIVDIFSNRSIQNMEARKEAITIRHLLKMQCGFEWNEFAVPYGHPDNDFTKLKNSSDWVQYTLDKPMVADPGTEFYYNSGGSHLLSAIIQNKTGMNTAKYAEQCLFDPLNITNYLWEKDPMGLSFGAGNLWFHPLDMLKFGYLYLQNGQWNGLQIVPAAWVQESIQDYNPGEWDYGYQWWLDTTRDYYYAEGAKGQFIIIKPDADLVVAITASGGGTIDPKILFNSFILKSVVEDVTVTYPTSTTSTTTTVITTTQIATTSTTTSDTPGFEIFAILGVVIVSSILVARRRRK